MLTHRFSTHLVGALALLLVGCGSDDSTSSSNGDGGGGQGGAVSTGGGGTGGAGTGGDGGSSSSGTGGGGTGGGSTGGGGTGGGGTGGQGGTASGDLTIQLNDQVFQMGVNCMPVVSPDPINGTFAAEYDNTAGQQEVTATITSTTLTMEQGNQSLIWTFTVDPTDVTVPAGVGLSGIHTKVPDSGTGQGDGAPCGYCGASWTLDVTWDVAGNSVSDSLGPLTVGCAY